MAIFSDTDNVTPPAVVPVADGWQSIGSLQERKKENTVVAKPWVGETLKAGKRIGAAEKMTIFKDQVSCSANEYLVDPYIYEHRTDDWH